MSETWPRQERRQSIKVFTFVRKDTRNLFWIGENFGFWIGEHFGFWIGENFGLAKRKYFTETNPT